MEAVVDAIDSPSRLQRILSIAGLTLVGTLLLFLGMLPGTARDHIKIGPEQPSMDLKADTVSQPKPAAPAASRQSVDDSADKPLIPFRRQHKHFNRYVLIATIAFLSIAVLPMVKIFAIPLMLAATFVTILYPMYQALKKALWNKPVLAAAASCLITVFCVLIPVYLFTYILTNQVMDLYSTAEPKVLELIRKGEEGKFRGVANSKYVRWVRRFNIDWRASFEKGMNTAAQVATDVINKTSASILDLAANVLITLFAMFYCLSTAKRYWAGSTTLFPYVKNTKTCFSPGSFRSAGQRSAPV